MNVQLNDGLTALVSAMEELYRKRAAYGLDPDEAFRTSLWYSKILTIPADDATREWRKWLAPGDQVQVIEEEEARLNYREVVREALLIARHRGGGIILPVGLPGPSNSPLNLNNIRKGQIKKVLNLTKDQVTPGPLERNPLSPDYGQPQHWTINGVQFHPSRVVLVNGRRPPGNPILSVEVWGNSIWDSMAQAIEPADQLPAILADLMKEAKIDVITIPDLAGMLSTKEGEDALLRRWTAVARMKSIQSVSIIDGGPNKEGTKTESWDQKQLTWSGLSDVGKLQLLMMAGAADIPMTRMTGEQQSGLSGADAGSLRNYYDSVGSNQKLRIQPQIRPLDEMMIRSALGERPPSVWYVWNTLYQMDELTAAQVDKLQAETSTLYANAGLVPTEALEKATHNRMIETGRWPGLEDAIEEIPEAERYGENETANENTQPGLTNETESARKELQSMDAAPRTLYVSRKVLNADRILDWAHSQGFEDTVAAEDLHVTIIYSTTPVDWMKMGQAWESKLEVPEGGPRLMDTFGKAKVLMFSATDLMWRNLMMREMGASFDHEEYQPHITISYGLMPEGVEPYQGPIVLGPEIFQEIIEDWAKTRGE